MSRVGQIRWSGLLSLLIASVSAFAAAPASEWWQGSYPQRRQVQISAGSAAVPAPYSVKISFDHAALVLSGRSRADGQDVRIVRWNGSVWTELDRVLDTGSAWNSATTELWFNTPVALAASGTDDDVYLYFGNPSPTAPPQNADNVFLFYDGFESGNLGRWTRDPTNAPFSVVTAQAHAGTRAVTHAVVNSSVNVLVPANTPTGNVYVDSWWWVGAPTVEVALHLRWQGVGGNNDWLANLIDNTGWRLQEYTSSTLFSRTSGDGTTPLSTWTRVGFAIDGTRLRGFRNGTQTFPAGSAPYTGPLYTAGTPALEVFRLPLGTLGYWDDVVIRRYADPEPTTALAAELKGPGQTCTLPAECGSGSCVGGCCGGACPLDAGTSGPDAGGPGSPGTGGDGGLLGHAAEHPDEESAAFAFRVGCGCGEASGDAMGLVAVGLFGLLFGSRRSASR